MIDQPYRTHKEHAAVVRKNSFNKIYALLGWFNISKTFYCFSVRVFHYESVAILRGLDITRYSHNGAVLWFVGIDEHCQK